MAACALLWSTQAAAHAVPPGCPADFATADIVDHDFSVSFCGLCDVGSVRKVIENPYQRSDDVDFADIIVREDPMISGPTCLPGTARFYASNVALPPLAVEIDVRRHPAVGEEGLVAANRSIDAARAADGGTAERPAVLRLSGVADVEPGALAERRLDRMKAEIMAAWDARTCCHELVVEPELHWRLGAPPSRPKEPGR